ncbi:MAG TPA: aldehyde dehydrogenase family protein, partial [Flavobacteriales bacterium]|nr:aldehyde dehydrogenase family protein [Flavobacteriales bacterium]
MGDVLNYIGGTLRTAVGGTWLNNHEPATGQVYGRIADSDARDVDTAVVAAEQALPDWIALGREGRSQALLRLAALVERDIDAFARAESRD